MSNKNVSDLMDVIKKIEDNKILLPDFQRPFVWKEPEKQRQLVASVLAKMPIGSILLLKSSNANEFSSKAIGKKCTIDVKDTSGEIEFLLDGQQRMTVLSNVFSNVLYKNMKSVTELVATSLKRRFFLCLPQWSNDGIENDIFGMAKLSFPVENLGAEPRFLSGDLLPYILTLDFKANGDEPFNPMGDGKRLTSYCISNKNGFLIPLYLLMSTKDIEMTRLGKIIEGIKLGVTGAIEEQYCKIEDENKKEKFVEGFLSDAELSEMEGDFKEAIECKFDSWWSKLNQYLQSCISTANLNQIVISDSNRGRAIDIYENLNLGGVSLSTFDLIMAKVAKVNNKNFFDRMIEYLQAEEKYPKKLIPEKIKNEIGKKTCFSASVRLKCYDEKKNKIDSKYIDAFLDILSLYNKNRNFNVDEIYADYGNRDALLSIEPEYIDANAESVCRALDRALFFLYVRCGIRKISEINNLLILVLIGYLFLNDKYFKSDKVHTLLEAWYWCALFCGEFDKDQKQNFIKNLKLLIQTIEKKNKGAWLRELKNNILAVVNYSDKNLLLLRKTEYEQYPKEIISNYICQYFLAQTYMSMFDNKKRISVFTHDELDKHHIIPLGSVKKIGQVSSELRNDKGNICNSPVNFIYITSTENNAISDKNISEYLKAVTPEAKSTLWLSGLDIQENVNNTNAILDVRFDSIQGAIRDKVETLLTSFGI